MMTSPYSGIMREYDSTLQPSTMITTTATTLNPLISSAILDILDTVLTCWVSYILAFFGVLTNMAVMAVLVAQGLRKNSINIALFALAVADLAYEFTVLSSKYCYIKATSYDISKNMVQEFIPHGVLIKVTFFRISSSITAFISLERFACVYFPLKFKRLVTAKCTYIIVLAIYVTSFVLYVPALLMFEVQWVDRGDNRTEALAVPTQFLLDNYSFLTIYGDLIISVTLSVSTLIVVLVSTVLTVLRLRWSARWRKSINRPTRAISSSVFVISSDQTSLSQENRTPTTTSSANSQRVNQSADNKSERLTKMLVMVACVYMICMMPSTVVSVVRFIIPEFNFNQTYHNIFTAVYTVDFTMQTLNAAVNFLVYITMSSRLCGLALLSVKREEVEKANSEDIIDKSAALKISKSILFISDSKLLPPKSNEGH